MSRISVFGIGSVSSTPFVTAKSLTNIYVENRPAGEKSAMVGYRTPGLLLFKDFASPNRIRGMRVIERTDTSFCIVGNSFYEVSSTGAATLRGTLNATTQGRVSISDNGTQVVIVDGTYGYVYDITTMIFAIIANMPPNPQTVTFLAGRFVVTIAQSTRFYWSDINDGSTWPALSFASAETSPDPLIAAWSANGQLILFGSSTTEYWGVSTSLDQPFNIIHGTATEWGLAAQWSVSKYDNSVAMLVKNRMGQVMIAQLAGYLPRKISTPDIDTIINGYSITSDATSFSAMVGGHPFFVISFPTAGATWLYDGSTSVWTRLKSFGLTRHRAEFGMAFANANIVADQLTPKLYKFTNTVFTDDGMPIQAEIVSETVASPDLERLTVDCLRLDIQVGQGTAAVPNPEIGLSVSRDNGNTYGAEMLRPLGPVGEYGKIVDWTRLGTASNFVFKLRVTDPFPFTLMNAIINPKNI